MLFEQERVVDVFRMTKEVIARCGEPTFNTVCYYIECAIKAADEDRIIEALGLFHQIKRLPKTKYL
jgi:hypothetical protein